jgi:hypothetical protein
MTDLTILVSEAEAVCILNSKAALDEAVQTGALRALRLNPRSPTVFLRSACERLARRQAAVMVGVE